MTFLPIIERELRVRARSGAAYWSRVVIGLAGLLVCLPPLLLSGPFSAGATMGKGVLDAVVGGAFLVSCAACLLTADIISSERREGTLGLLLLTRVRVFDVLVGKLGSAGLTSLCALVVLLPMLMIPVLAGGVTGGEAFRKGLVLLDTLFLGLAAGLWASARAGEWLKTGRNALIVMAIAVLAPVVVGPQFGKPGAAGAGLELLSPLGALSAAREVVYRSAAANYWISLLLVQAVGWALVVSAGLRLRHGWREARGETAVPAPATDDLGEAEAAQLSHEPLDDDLNPLVWLLQRQRGLRPVLWAGALVGCTHYWAIPVMLRLVSPSSYWSIASPLMLASAIVEGALFAWAASRFFMEARRTGELEMLLTTPMGARHIVSTQWEVLKRALRWPLVVMIVPSILQAGFGMVTLGRVSGLPAGYMLHSTIGQALGCVNTVLGLGALCWLGMWFGLRANGQGRAVVWTVAIGRGLPYLISVLSWLIFIPLARWSFGRVLPSYWIGTWLPQVLSLILYLALIQVARRRLLGGLAGGDQMAMDLWGAIFSGVRDAVAGIRKARHWTPS